MNKKVIFIGLGVVALGGLAFFLFRKKPSAASEAGAADAATRAADAPTGGGETYDEGAYDDTALAEAGVPLSRKEQRQERRQNRRDCRAEAKARGLRGKAKREFKRECKAAGGLDNMDFMSEQSEFAFNGYGDF